MPGLELRIAGWRTGVADASWPWMILPTLASVTAAHLLGVSCPFRAATGLDCPACGGTRAFLNLVHGRVIDALHYNFLAVVLGAVLVPLVAMRLLGWTMPRRIETSLAGRHPAAVLVAVLLIWTVFRNLPAMAWFNTSWATR